MDETWKRAISACFHVSVSGFLRLCFLWFLLFYCFYALYGPCCTLALVRLPLPLYVCPCTLAFVRLPLHACLCTFALARLPLPLHACLCPCTFAFSLVHFAWFCYSVGLPQSLGSQVGGGCPVVGGYTAVAGYKVEVIADVESPYAVGVLPAF